VSIDERLATHNLHVRIVPVLFINYVGGGVDKPKVYSPFFVNRVGLEVDCLPFSALSLARLFGDLMENMDIDRYDSLKHEPGLVKSPNGEWVKYADVERGIGPIFDILVMLGSLIEPFVSDIQDRKRKMGKL